MSISDHNVGVVTLFAQYEQFESGLPAKRDDVALYQRRLAEAQRDLAGAEHAMADIRAVLEKLGFEPDAD